MLSATLLGVRSHIIAIRKEFRGVTQMILETLSAYMMKKYERKNVASSKPAQSECNPTLREEAGQEKKDNFTAFSRRQQMIITFKS
jgi:hypothetical protein